MTNDQTRACRQPLMGSLQSSLVIGHWSLVIRLPMPNATKLFDLTGRVALVTGGNRGLGKAMARGLAQAGADVFLASRNETELKATLDEITAETGRKGGYCVTDVTRREDVARLARTALERMGRVDVLINN